MDNLSKTECSFYRPWKPADAGGCCTPGQSPHLGYSAADPAVSYQVRDQLMIAKSLTVAKNTEDPYEGTLAAPPTWVLRTLDQHILAITA